MAIKNDIQQKIDPVRYRQNAGYIKNGLTVTSNNPVIHPRDEAGNIILQENSETNPLLIIEPVTTKISMNSMLKVLDTTFQYFKFPVSVTPVSSDINLEFGLNLDPIYARYKPSTIEPILTSGIYSGILMDEIVDGLTQRNINTYTINKDIKNSGVDLRFRIKLQHYFAGPGNIGTAYFSLISSGPDRPTNREYLGPYGNYATGNPRETRILEVAPIVLRNIGIYVTLAIERLNLIPPSEFKTARLNWFTQLRNYLPLNIPTTSGFRFNDALINSWLNPQTQLTGLQSEYDSVNEGVTLYRQLVTEADEYSPEFGIISLYETQNLYVDVVIPNSTFEIGDSFQIGAQAGQPGHSINSEQTYWVITDASKNVDLWNVPVENTSLLGGGTINTGIASQRI
jgi:hypothetical protein